MSSLLRYEETRTEDTDTSELFLYFSFARVLVSAYAEYTRSRNRRTQTIASGFHGAVSVNALILIS